MGTYWENRAMESVGRWENAVNQKAREMAQAFEEAKKAIEGEIYSFYGRYAKNNQITMEEAKKALSRKELAEFKGTLAEYEQLARNSIGTFNLEVENLSMKARLTRLDALLLQIDGELQRLYQQLREGIAETTENVLIEEYYHTKYNLSVEAKRMLAFSKIPKSFIEQVLAYPIAGADISARLWKQGADTSFYIRQTLNRMFIEGRPPQDFAEGLAKKIGAVQIDKEGKVTGGGKKYEAYRLLYNEASYATNQADLRSYREDEVPYYDISATLDTQTSPICRSLDRCRFYVTSGGKVPEEYKKTGSQYRQAAYSTDRVIVGVNYPPFHVGCRTTTTPAYETTDIASMSRAASDANGKYITVPASMTYEEWYETFVDGGDKSSFAVVDDNKHQKRGDLQISDEGDIIKKVTFREFQSGNEVNDFFYYDDEKRGLLVKKNSSYGIWESGLSANQKAAVSEYSAGGYSDLNNYLRRTNDWEHIDAPMMEMFKANLQSVTSSFELKEPIKVYRYTGIDTFGKKSIKELVGTEFTDNGFMSTSPALEGIESAIITGKDILLEISVPNGKGYGAYINNLSTMKNREYEFLFNCGSKFDIVSVDTSGNIPIVRMVAK